jgi:hypothetical protein
LYYFILLWLDPKKQRSRLASSATSRCTLWVAKRTRLSAQTAFGLSLRLAGLMPASGSEVGPVDALFGENIIRCLAF